MERFYEKGYLYGRDQHSFSALGLEIHALNSFLKDVEKGAKLRSNANVVTQSEDWSIEGIIPDDEIPHLKYQEELSNYLNILEPKDKKERERPREIRDLLLRMCKEFGFEITRIEPGEMKVKVFYQHLREKEDMRTSYVPDSLNLLSYGVERVVESKPTHNEGFDKVIRIAYELRILQSTF